MRAMIALAFLVGSPVWAQTGSTIAPPSAAATQAFAREQQAAGEFNRSGGARFAYDADEATARQNRATILRAGAWGRCVVATEPSLSRAYVDKKSSTLPLQAAFKACLHRTGDFVGSSWGGVRRAALTDALAAL